ncbi:UPF0182 family protein [Arthrobacter sp. EH-1B-1]|uniref:UPF0182 protein P4U43_04245 n=1 Tax=Arthrobacter vasquezii TaxID=2977629 RepID=A0ABT6CSI8_9MICC|nr:UPF0182 family protein [Arthrobacter vasquezii]MDF9276999.1 UPF0182 family protein [Arthrobacter vasquezii]
MVPTLIVLGLLVVGFVYFSQVYADVLWYNQLGFLEVFVTENLSRIGLFVAAFLIMGASVYFSLRIAYRSRPIYAPDSSVQDNLNRYQAQLEPIRRLLMIGIPVVLGAFAGTAASSQWERMLLFFNSEPFGETDPEFGLDIGFYVFTLPFLSFLLGFLVSVIVISGIAGVLTHYLYGGIRLEEKGLFTSKAARTHIAVLAALFLILQGVNYWLDRYSTVISSDGKWAGALYTDVNAVIPTKAILAAAAIIVAVLFIISAVIGRWRLPVIGTAMLVITAILAGGVYPWVIQRFQVVPSEFSREEPFIERNIEMTRAAYGLDQVQVNDYGVEEVPQEGALNEDGETTANIRLLDPNLVSDAFSQLQQFRQYYQFPEILNVDRYEIDGEIEDTVIAVRELNTAGVPDGWINEHVYYTHGYGVVAAAGSTVEPDGRPEFIQSGIPTTGLLGDESTFEPRIYFGEESPEYSIVGAPEGATPLEIDRPQTEESDQEARSTFLGDGGPQVGNFFNRLVYALKFQSTDLLLSDQVTSESQILYDRDPVERVEKVAPYLTLDSNTYPAIVDGRVKWIIEGYTTTSDYPYSTQQELQSATVDSLTAEGVATALPAEQVNYIRNAVKATVDAYDGSVDLYAWDDQDPILKAWQKVYPTSLQPYSEMSADLMAHVRYPEDLFKVQRELLARYHVTETQPFYSNNQAWAVPVDPTLEEGEQDVKQPPFYLSLQMPDQESASFSLTTPFIPFVPEGQEPRNILYGFLAADGDAGTGEPGVKAETYGTLRLLDSSGQDSAVGPGQAANLFNSDTEVSQELNLLRQGASEVISGNLLTLPIGGGIAYVQPVYVQSSGDSSFPVLRRVLVSFGDQVGFAPTLDEALDQVFQGDSGAVTGDSENVGETPDLPAPLVGSDSGNESPEEPTEEPTTPAEPGTGDPAADLRAALEEANAAIQEGQTALAEGDFAAYGEAQERLDQALQRALDAETRLSEASGGATE